MCGVKADIFLQHHRTVSPAHRVCVTRLSTIFFTVSSRHKFQFKTMSKYFAKSQQEQKKLSDESSTLIEVQLVWLA